MSGVEFSWFSPALGRTMRGVRWGDRGKALLLYPTAAGDHREVERFGLLGAIEGLVQAGRIRVYSVESISGEGWLREGGDPVRKAALQNAYDRYVADELLPMVRHELGDPLARLMVAGASIGAYNAVNSLCKFPDRFWLAVAMSGTYDFDRFVGGDRSEDYYYSQPLLYLPNLGEGAQLDWLRRSYLLLATGQGRWEAPWETGRLADLLAARNVPHHAEFWGYDVDHDWPTWRAMLPMFLDRFA